MKDSEINILKYRRQFLFCKNSDVPLVGWKKHAINDYYLHIHPDNEFTELTKDEMSLALIGDFINPHEVSKSNLDIMHDIACSKELTDVFKKLYFLGGRFVLIFVFRGKIFFFHDPCGLKMIFYTKQSGNVYAASQPLLLKEVVDINLGEKYDEYQRSNLKRSIIEHWIPSGSSLYEDVHHLVPNHYLEIYSFEQIRYWPNKKYQVNEFDVSLNKFTDLLKNTMIAANNRFDLAMPLTAGWDSRLILSACKDISDDLYFYTLKYRSLDENSNDIKIPRKLLHKFKLKHNLLNCKRKLDPDFIRIYEGNSDMAHIDDWGHIANGMKYEFPPNKTVIKGNAGEIFRCTFLDLNPDTSTYKSFLGLGSKNLDGDVKFVEKQIQYWFNGLIKNENNFGYSLLDLFKWEQDTGSWQAQAQLEWDIVQDAFTPYNNRELMDIALSVNPELRRGPKYLFFLKAIENLWSDVLSEPINPKPFSNVIKESIIKNLKRLGLYDFYKSIK